MSNYSSAPPQHVEVDWEADAPVQEQSDEGHEGDEGPKTSKAERLAIETPLERRRIAQENAEKARQGAPKLQHAIFR